MKPEVWSPVMSVHEMTTDDVAAVAPAPRPLEGLCNVRVLVTDSTGAVAGMDACNVSEEVTKSVVGTLIREHAANVKKILASDGGRK